MWLTLTRSFLTRCWSKLVWVHLAAQLIVHGKVNKADASGDQGIDEPYSVQPRLELGWDHAHKDLPAEGLHTVLTLHTLTYTLCRHDMEGQREDKCCIIVGFNFSFSVSLSLTHTIRAPAVPAGIVFDGGSGRQLHTGEEAGTRGKLHTFPI